MRNGTTVLISGASIAGPALAHWLHRRGFAVTVVEKAPAPRPGGHKVDIRGAAIDVVERMGLREQIRARDTDIRGGTWYNHTGKEVTTLSGDLIGFRDPGDLEVLRGELSDILLRDTRDDVEYVFGDAATAVDDTGDGVEVAFEHGAPRRFDVVVGADGLHSGVRALAFGEESRFTRPLGLAVAVFSVPNHLKLDGWEVAYSTARRTVDLWGLGAEGDATALCYFPSPEPMPDRHDRGAQERAVAAAFDGHGWEMPAILAAMPRSPDLYFDALAQVHMPRWSTGRTVLLGDAAYCPSPASGQGTSLALVGAYILAGELAEADDPRTAFDRYEAEMRRFVALNQRLGRDLVKAMIPKSRMRAALRLATLRAMPYMPGKSKVIDKIMKPIREAAGGIALKAYADGTAELPHP